MSGMVSSENVGFAIGFLIFGFVIGFTGGYSYCRIVLRSIVSDECGKELAKKVFGEKP